MLIPGVLERGVEVEGRVGAVDVGPGLLGRHATAVVKLSLPAGFSPKGAKVRVALPEGIREVTQLNNSVGLP